MPPEPRVRRRRPIACSAVVLVVLAFLATGAWAAPAAASVAIAHGVGQVEVGGDVLASTGQRQPPTGEPDDAGEADRDPLPVPEPSAEDANEQADEILDHPKFDEPPKSLLDRVLEWIAEQLDKIEIPGLGGAGAGGSQVVGWIFIAALAGLAVYLLSKTRLSRRPDRGDPAFLVGDEVVRSQHEWIGEAEAFEASGEWKQALRCRFRALVAALIDRGVVRDIPGRTTGEYRVEVSRNASPVASEFSGAAELFDRAWYGDEATGPEENARFRALSDEVVRGVDAAAAARAEVPAGVAS